ncbi:hypothetical protein [Nocardioides dongxiaopingii]|uniref:hypothetical protein n=1 Tax=Nocardioides dongxiaopingii TaxID=2576036 RepID=UPI0010C769DC|nr:hypothetical protein [Nocardioides dongxiaopingii]
MSQQSPGGPPTAHRPSGSPAPTPGRRAAPRRRRRPPTALLAVGGTVLVLVVALVVTLVVVRGGDDPGSARTDPATTGTATTSPVEPADGAVVAGTGYAFHLPDAWEDATGEAAGLEGGDGIDALVVLGSSVEAAQSNVLVEAIPAGSATDPDDLESLWKSNLGGSDGAEIDDADDIEIDGQRAIGVRIPQRTNGEGLEFTQVAYLALHGGTQYSIALTFPHSGDEVSETDFEQLLASWSWTD